MGPRRPGLALYSSTDLMRVLVWLQVRAAFYVWLNVQNLVAASAVWARCVLTTVHVFFSKHILNHLSFFLGWVPPAAGVVFEVGCFWQVQAENVLCSFPIPDHLPLFLPTVRNVRCFSGIQQLAPWRVEVQIILGIPQSRRCTTPILVQLVLSRPPAPHSLRRCVFSPDAAHPCSSDRIVTHLPIPTPLINLVFVSIPLSLHRCADAFSPDAGARLFGLISAGATLGQLVGSLLTVAVSRATAHAAGGTRVAAAPLYPLLFLSALLM